MNIELQLVISAALHIITIAVRATHQALSPQIPQTAAKFTEPLS